MRNPRPAPRSGREPLITVMGGKHTCGRDVPPCDTPTIPKSTTLATPPRSVSPLSTATCVVNPGQLSGSFPATLASTGRWSGVVPSLFLHGAVNTPRAKEKFGRSLTNGQQHRRTSSARVLLTGSLCALIPPASTGAAWASVGSRMIGRIGCVHDDRLALWCESEKNEGRF